MPKIVRFHETGAAEVLKIEDLPTPEPRAGEIRLKVEAIGLNRAEVLFRQGMYIEQPGLPSTLGYEAAGVVDAIGPGVSNVKVGDRVSSLPAHSQQEYGVYGEVAIVPAASVYPYPARLSAAEAAAIWVQYLTGYFALVELGRLQSGQHALITAASSSTGIAAIEITRALGATSIVTTRSDAKRQLLLDLGANHVIVTDREDLASRVLEITGGKGAEVIYDPVAGPGFESLGRAAAHRGTIVEYGMLSEGKTILPLVDAFVKSLRIHVYKVFDFTGNPKLGLPRDEDVTARALHWIYTHLEKGDLKPKIARTFPLAQIVEAHKFMESNEQVGKIVVTV